MAHSGAGMRALYLLQALLVVQASLVEDGVSTLDSDPSVAQLEVAAGGAHDETPGFPNFPGPRYGMPGYKESHNWEDPLDVDLFSPLIFDWRAYAAKYPGVKSQKQAQEQWLAKLNSLSYPNCRQGRQHDHPPAGFSLKLYYDVNQVAVNLGDAPKCIDIAKQFLSAGVFEGLPWAVDEPVSPDDIIYPNNDGNDGAVPASSWALCKWRRGSGKFHDLNVIKSMENSFHVRQLWSKTLKPYDLVLSKYDQAMPGFFPTTSYTVTFWYRPYVCFKGEIFNFGESVDFKATTLNGWGTGNNIYWSPGVEQSECTGTGVRLTFRLSTGANREHKCDVAGADGKGVIPLRKWTFIALTVKSSDTGMAGTVYYDNNLSYLEKAASGDTDSGEGKLNEIQKCDNASPAYVPTVPGKYGFAVSSFFPKYGKLRGGDARYEDADVAGIAYYNKALSKDEVTRMYRYEEKGTPGWSVADAKTSDNGVCG